MRRGHTEDGRARLREGARKRWADPAFRAKMIERRWGGIPSHEWQPPEEFRDLYADLRAKFHACEARRLVEDHMAVVERRKARVAQPVQQHP